MISTKYHHIVFHAVHLMSFYKQAIANNQPNQLAKCKFPNNTSGFKMLSSVLAKYQISNNIM